MKKCVLYLVTKAIKFDEIFHLFNLQTNILLLLRQKREREKEREKKDIEPIGLKAYVTFQETLMCIYMPTQKCHDET